MLLDKSLIFHLSSHLSPNRESRWGTTDDFSTSFLHFFLFSTALWDLANSRPVSSLITMTIIPAARNSGFYFLLLLL